MESFRSEVLSEHIIRIIDPLHVAMYLVIGEQSACLLDTGCGVGNIAEYVASLTEKPLVVVLTHGHFDHAGGANLFPEVYLNHADLELYHLHQSASYRQQLIPLFPRLAEYSNQRTSTSSTTIHCLHNGQCFDLAGIHVVMIAVPGHTQGMMMALIPEEKTILFGDACGVSVLLFEDSSSCVSSYRNTLLQFKTAYQHRYHTVLRNHGTYCSCPAILDQVIDVCDEILLQKDDHIPTSILGKEGFFLAKQVDSQQERIDGLQGNLIYRSDKAN